MISAGQGEPANDDLGLWWRAAGHGYFRGTLEDAQMYDIYSGDYYISDNELWVAFQTLADRTGTELAGNIDGMDRLLNEIVIRSDGQAPLDSSDNSLTVDHLNQIDFRGTGVDVVAVNDTYGQSVRVTIDAGSGISQTDADARYVELAGDTMTDTLTVTPADNSVALLLDARALTTQTPFVFFMNASGNQQAFWLRRGTDSQAFLTIDGNIGGGNANPGIALGPGGSTTRDVTIYRGGSNALATQDAFTAKTLGLASGTIDGQSAAQRLATTQSNLGIGFVIADLTAESTIDPDADLLGFADVSASDPEERKATIEQVLTGSVSSDRLRRLIPLALMELAAAEAFDIHDDVSPAATIADDDRVIFSDEGAAPYPMRYTTAANLADYMQTEVRIPTGSLVNDAVTQAKMADDSVGVPQLKLGTGEMAFNSDIDLSVNRYAFSPRTYRTASGGDSARCALLQTRSHPNGSSLTTTIFLAQVGAGTCRANWDFVQASDNPSVWAMVQDSTGTVVGLFESEDPAGTGAPFSYPFDDNGNTLPGYTVIDVGLPSLTVLEALYGDLPASQRTAAQDALDAYMIQRGWLTGPHTHDTIAADYAAVVERYQPSVIQWAMREAAVAAGLSTTAFYLDKLVVTAGAWARP